MDFDTAFGTHYPALFRYLHRLTGDADRAADIAQESFVRLLDRSLPAEKVRGWLYTVATNLVRDDARTRDRRRRLLEAKEVAPEPPPRPDQRVERAERIAAVRGVLDALPARDQQLLLLREAGFRYAEIAQIVGVPRTSVGKMLARALARFARAYGGEDDEINADDDDGRDDRDGSPD